MDRTEFENTYMQGFNSQQIQAAEAVNGPVLLSAVPGSGKTTVLITRIGYMTQCAGIDPSSILVMTYTRAATQEMRQRFAALFGENTAQKIHFSTINSLALSIINQYAKMSSHPNDWHLASEDEIREILKEISFNATGGYTEENALQQLRTGITYAKNSMLDDSDILLMDKEIEHFSEICHAYIAEMKKRRWMDFDDQLDFAYRFLKGVGALRAWYQEHCRYILVDEAQDTSLIQYRIISLLAEKSRNLFMVGDEDQSIYGFRAARPDIMMHFKEDWSGAEILLMETNYRSTGQIVTLADQFIQKNTGRYQKSMHAAKKNGSDVHLIRVRNRKDQYRVLVHAAETAESQTAVLYRNNSSAVVLIDLLDRAGVPFRCRNMDTLFFSSRIVSDMTDIMTFALFPDNTEVFMRIYYKLGQKISKGAAEKACRMSRRLQKPVLDSAIGDSSLPLWLRNSLITLRDQLKKLTVCSGEEALKQIWNTIGYSQYADSRNMDTSDLNILVSIAEHTDSARALLDRLDELDQLIRSHRNPDHCNVILSTIHSSKGLEYRQVYLMDVIDQTFPAAGFSKDPDLYQEERRLFYVGMTRAMEELYLFEIRSESSVFIDEVKNDMPREIFASSDVFSFLKDSMMGKKFYNADGRTGEIIAQDDDRVLIQYKKDVLEEDTLAGMLAKRRKTYGEEKKEKSDSSFYPAIGMVIVHKTFGEGTITSYDQSLMTVDFHGDVKKLSIRRCMKKHLIHQK